MVRILELVDHDVAVARSDRLTEPNGIAQSLSKLEDQVAGLSRNASRRSARSRLPMLN